ncbi:MAG TPA: WYL domain-containing protein [Isosphaeraceae bacterium]
MTPSARRDPLCRLLQIVLALQSDRRPNARQLAEECEVSRRTIFRDLETIGLAGLAVEYDATRQGYRIASEVPVRSTGLDEREVLALAVLLNARADADPFGLHGRARSALRKLVAGLTDPARRRAEAVDLATHAQSPPIPLDAQRRSIYEGLLEGVVRGVQVRLTLRGPGHGSERTRLTPYRLLPLREGWAVIGRSSLHRKVRLIPLAGVAAVELTDEAATVPPRFRVDRWLARTWSGEPGPGRREVQLRFDAEMAAAICDGLWHRSQRLEPLPDGRVDLRLTLDRPEDLAPWVLGHGEHVEVLAPARLRREVRRLATRVARRYGSPRRESVAAADFGRLGG